MSDPLEQFKSVFFEEGGEAIDAIESNLLGLGDGPIDSEVINDIFRAAHSLKGGSATFGMSFLTEFTHVMETLLDKVRANQLDMTQDIIDCLFSSLDILRNLIAHYQYQDDINQAELNNVRQSLEALLIGGAAAKPSQPAPAKVNTGNIWKVTLAPFEGIMMTGNDPLRYIEELQDLGNIEVKVDTRKVPEFSELSPTSIKISWEIIVTSEDTINEEVLSEIFAWIEDDADLEFEQLQSKQSVSEPQTTPETPPSPALVDSDIQAPAAPSKAPQKTAGAEQKPQKRNSQSIRVALDKIDSLINLLGELVITQSMLNVYNDTEKYPQFERLTQGLAQLERHTRDLQEGVMQIRMLPIDFCFSRFPRMVRDLAKQLHKSINVDIVGETTEVDKTVIEELNDPLVHLVRNSADHGIEMPAVRKANGKNETGTITLKAFNQVGNIIIEIIDDGAGLNTEKIRQKAIENGVINAHAKLTDKQVNELIFAPGFSTADEITDVSGRGVGMDVVRRNIQGLGGVIDVYSTPGQGSTFAIRLPLTLAILDGQLVKAGSETYIIPMLSIIESIQLQKEHINQVGNKSVSCKWRDRLIPILNLADVFSIPRDQPKATDNSLMVVVESDNKQCGILVDELTNHQQVVVKSLEANYTKVDELSGATILGDGSVALIINVASIVSRVRVH